MLSRRKVGRNHNEKLEVTMVQEKARVKIRTDSEKYLHPLNALHSHTHTHTHTHTSNYNHQDDYNLHSQQ